MRKKLWICGVSCILIAVLVVSGIVLFYHPSTPWDKLGEVAATVNGEKIYRVTVEKKQYFGELSYQNALKQINEHNDSAEHKQELLQQLSPAKTYDEWLSQSIRDKAAYLEAKRRGLKVSKKEARAQALSNYEGVKQLAEDENDSTGAAFLYQYEQKFMQQWNLTEDEYLEMSADIQQQSMMSQKLFEVFKEKECDFSIAKTPKEQFDAYVEELVAKAKVVYFDRG